MGNGKWDGGMIHPYKPAEPITWMPEPVSIRPRWDTVLGDTPPYRHLVCEFCLIP